MKKILLIFVVMFSVTVLAQSPSLKSDAKKSKTTGNYEFVLPSSISTKDVTKAASYYISNFSVVKENSIVKIKMVDNTSYNRHVMKRFFVSLNQRTISVNNKDMKIDAFFDELVK